jgi:YHS domain-containing protein
MIKTCPICKKLFNVIPSKIRQTNCCTKQCSDELKRRQNKEDFMDNPRSHYKLGKTRCTCEWIGCEREFWVIKSMANARRFCSEKCYHDWRRNNLKLKKIEDDNIKNNPYY